MINNSLLPAGIGVSGILIDSGPKPNAAFKKNFKQGALNWNMAGE